MMAARMSCPPAVDIEVAKRLGIRPDQVTQHHRDQVLRHLMDRQAQVPVYCDREQIVAAPARGPVLLFHPRETVITDAGNVVTKKVGRFAAMMVQDAFLKAELQAVQRKQPAPYTPGQIDVGREYRDLFDRCASSGLKLSQIGGTGGGGGGAGGVSEAMLADMQQLRRLQRRIGTGTAMAVRRVRPSRRGGTVERPARNITDQRLVHLFCVDGETLSGVLTAHGWSDRGQSKTILHRALCAALDRMRGYADKVVRKGIDA
jgi:hypothetical protein